MKYLRISLLLIAMAWALGGCNSSTNDSENQQEQTDEQQGSQSEEKEEKESRPVGSDASDFQTFFNEALVGRSSNNIDEALNAIIHPEMGVHLIHKPGAIPKPEYCENVGELKAIRSSILEDFTRISKNIKKGELPFFNCDAFDKEGAYYTEHGNNGILEKSFRDMADMMYVDIPEETYEQARKADEAITHTAVSTNASLQLGFGQIEGKWRLISVDIAIYDCGA